jgi:hypothetical protein
MDDSAVKETRQILRRIQDHLFQAHSALGVTHESVGFVDVVYHHANTVPDLNYATPRRNTAWVSGKFIQQGLERLRALSRLPRVQYIEGLYPPQFAKTLSDLGLEPERATAIMAYTLDDPRQKLPRTSSPAGVRLETVTDQRANKLWRALWGDDSFDVLTLGVEPLEVGGEAPDAQTVDILMRRDDAPIGVMRLSIQPSTRSAHVVALALLHAERTQRLTKLLLTSALRAALKQDCTMVFAPGESDDDRDLARKLGFVDVGTMVCYAARSESVTEVQGHDNLLQPVLARRR